MFSGKTDSTSTEATHRSLTWSRILLTALFPAALIASGCVIHDGRHGRGHRSSAIVVQPLATIQIEPAPIRVAPAPVTFVFTDHHRHSVRNYYSHHRGHHGKRKWKNRRRGHPGRGHGPPRWAHKGGHMPSGVTLQAIPHDLATQLPPAPRGTQFIYHSDAVLLVDVHTHVVLDSISVSVGF